MIVTDSFFTTNALTVRISMATGTPWWLSMVYGPRDDDAKITFRVDCTEPWMLCGDLTSSSATRTRTRATLTMMGKF